MLQTYLKEYFGFDSFRPLQENIIRDVLAGKDVFALLPTGGGKSLCFQLPALARPGLTLVISPLISLMKDQVDALEASGISATFLNSSLSSEESRCRLLNLHNRKYRLLYVAPERAVMPAFLNELVCWNVNLVAIDEAHCISEWGHDFRPEYRQLSDLRKLMPGVPFMALTATATSRVQTDIHRHLQLRDARSYVASFNRPNLTYTVMPKIDPYDQLLNFVRTRAQESGIVYCQSRKTTEYLTQRLSADGISAAPYHAGMEQHERTRNQEQFLRDENRVVCATIAFGMGINKSNVRFVVHYDLPKNIEGYYQETGRAGRDGLQSDCLLLFSRGDMIKQLRFIEEKDNEQERRIARAQLEEIVHYAESHECRRLLLLEYFGERYPRANCNGCDNCLIPKESVDATTEAQKFLSCVLRVREKSGFGVGLRHVVDVLTGGDTEKIRKWKHNQLSTYGIGKERSRQEWMTIGRELMRLRLLQQQHRDGFGIVEVSPEGVRALRERKAISLAMMKTSDPFDSREIGQEYDTVLFDRLRMFRKRIADGRDVPAYVVFSDAALRQMARSYPSTREEFLRVSGVGERKLRDFGDMFIQLIQDFLQSNPKRLFGEKTRTVTPKRWMNETTRETVKLFRSGQSVEGIAGIRALRPGTIYSHLLKAIEAGETIDVCRLVPPDDYREILWAFGKLGDGNLTRVFELLGEKYGYGLLRIVRSVEHGKIEGEKG